MTTDAPALTAAALRARRQALGLSQLQLARALGVSYPTVFRWERGDRELPALLEPALRWLEHPLQCPAHGSK